MRHLESHTQREDRTCAEERDATPRAPVISMRTHTHTGQRHGERHTQFDIPTLRQYDYCFGGVAPICSLLDHPFYRVYIVKRCDQDGYRHTAQYCIDAPFTTMKPIFLLDYRF